MDIKLGKTYYFYDNRAEDGVCKAHILHVLPHPERENDQLIVYRWYGKHSQRWWYGITTISQQELWTDYVHKVIKHRKQKRQYRKCGEGGYFMRHVRTDDTPDDSGDCGSIGR